MLKILRNIRQKLVKKGKIQSYFLYAIGEVFLIVIGILIALKISNTNDRNKQLKHERQLLEIAIENISRDSISIDSIISATNKMLEVHNNLIAYSKKEITEKEVGNIDLIRKSEPNQLITKTNNLNLPNELLDLDLKKVLLEYYLASGWFEKVLSDNNQIIEEYIRPILAEKQLLNFHAEINVKKTNKGIVNKAKFFEAFESGDIKQYLFESRIKLQVMDFFAKDLMEVNTKTKRAIQDYLAEKK